jgi:hypothetical protein
MYKIGFSFLAVFCAGLLVGLATKNFAYGVLAGLVVLFFRLSLYQSRRRGPHSGKLG